MKHLHIIKYVNIKQKQMSIVDTTEEYINNINKRKKEYIECEINRLKIVTDINNTLNVICFSSTFSSKNKINNELIKLLSSKIGEYIIIYSLDQNVNQLTPIIINTSNFITIFNEYISNYITRSLEMYVNINDMKNQLIGGFSYQNVDFARLKNIDKVIYFIL